MNILHLLYESKGDYFGIGGVETRAYEIYGRLKDHHDITLLCKKYPGAIDGEKEGLRHMFVGADSTSLTKTLLSYAYHAARFVRRHGNEYDIIVEEFSPAIPTFLHAVTRKPVILQVQGHTGKLYFRKYNHLYATTLFLLERLRPRFYENFIFLNPETARRFPLGSEKHIEIVPNGIPPALLDVPVEDGGYVLYIGRLDLYGKGLDLLIKAYREFHASFPDMRLVVAGDGRDRKAFQAELMSLPGDMRKDIELLGWVTDEKKADAIRRASICVFPSRHEVQPIAALEAMACGKPLIVSEIPEFAFDTRCGAGISFEAGNALSLARSMQDMMESRDRKEMGQKGREWVTDLTWDEIARKYESFLGEVLNENGLRA